MNALIITVSDSPDGPVVRITPDTRCAVALGSQPDVQPAAWAAASAAAGAAAAVYSETLPCSVCGELVRVGLNMPRTHDCKPVPLARLEAMTAERDKALAELAALRHDIKADARLIIAEWRSKAESAWSAAHNAKEALRDAQAQRDELAALLQAALPMILEIAPRVQRELLIGDIRAALARLTPTAPANGAENKE